LKQTLSLIAGILFIAGFVPYIRAILKRETKPAKASWIIWATLDSITLVGMYFKGTINGQIVWAVMGAWIVAALALKFGTPGWTKLDKFCLFGAVLSIVLWKAFNDPIFGIMTSLSVVFIGAIPTFASAWKDPGCEDRLAWTIFWISCVCAVIAIPNWTLADASQPLTFFTIETVMMYILYIKARFSN
jgi:hypothetical protein